MIVWIDDDILLGCGCPLYRDEYTLHWSRDAENNVLFDKETFNEVTEK